MEDITKLGIACLVPVDKYIDKNIGIIDNEANNIFNQNYNKMKNSIDKDKCQVVYVVSMPVIKNKISLRNFFLKLDKFLSVTKDYNSYFFNVTGGKDIGK